MMENDERTSVDRILGLASKWQMAEATALVNELSAPDISENFRACRALLNGIQAMNEGRYETGIQEALPALAYLEQHGFRSRLDSAYSTIGFAFGMLGAPDLGLEWVNRAIVGAERRSDEAQLRRSFSDKGHLFARLDETSKSVASFDQALALADSARSPLEKVELFNKIAQTYLQLARRLETESNPRVDLARKATDLAQSALSALEGASNDRLQALSLETLGSALSILGNLAEAEVAFEKALLLSEPHVLAHVELLTSYAWLLCELQRYEESAAMLDRAYERAQEHGQAVSLDRIFETHIRIEMLTGNNREAWLWSERRFRLMESQYRQRLTSIARHAEIFVEHEKARLAKQEARERRDAPAGVNETVESPSRDATEEGLRDELTGCLNQRGLALSVEAAFVPGWNLGLAIADIDHFQSINDRHGQDAGDKVLQSIAKIFNKSLRDSDRVARLEGEEFLLFINGVETDAAWGTCERLRLAVERFGWGTIAPGLRVTISIGLAVRMNDEDLDALNSKANSALQQAKAAGRNRVIAG